MSLNIRANSRFALSTPILTLDGHPTFGIAQKFKFMDRDNLLTGEIKTIIADSRTAGRPDLLALDIYRNSDLHWILIIFNRVENPFNWPINGQMIEYPASEVVFAEL